MLPIAKIRVTTYGEVYSKWLLWGASLTFIQELCNGKASLLNNIQTSPLFQGWHNSYSIKSSYWSLPQNGILFPCINKHCALKNSKTYLHEMKNWLLYPKATVHMQWKIIVDIVTCIGVIWGVILSQSFVTRCVWETSWISQISTCDKPLENKGLFGRELFVGAQGSTSPPLFSVCSLQTNDVVFFLILSYKFGQFFLPIVRSTGLGFISESLVWYPGLC